MFCGYHDGYSDIVLGSRTVAEHQIQGQGWWYAEALASHWRFWDAGAFMWLSGLLLIVLGILRIVYRTLSTQISNVFLCVSLALFATGFVMSLFRDLGVLHP